MKSGSHRQQILRPPATTLNDRIQGGGGPGLAGPAGPGPHTTYHILYIYIVTMGLSYNILSI